MVTRRSVLITSAAGMLALNFAPLARGQDKYRVGIAMPGTITDKGWSEAAFKALERAQAELGIEFSYAERVEQPDQVEVLSDYARKGYNLVIGHGGEFQDAISRIATDFPELHFVVNNGGATSANVTIADFHFAQLAYVMGFTAAKVSTSGKIGILVAQEFKFTLDSAFGFRAGAEAAVPNTQVLYNVMGDWNDVSKGKEAALAQLSQGADVLWPTMDGANVGALQAVQEKGAKAIGIYYDAITDWPEIMVQSAILDVTENMLKYLRLAVAGGLGGVRMRADLTDEKVMRIGSFGPAVSEATKTEVLALIDRLKSGEVNVPEG
jgi:basic membrane protein A and related proteins